MAPRILDQRFDPAAPIASLHEHPRNARRGDEEFIAESIDVNGFFGAVVVDDRNGNVLVGNHRYRMLVRAGGATIPALYLTPEDDAHATRIMLADNAGADRATYERTLLAALLAEVKEAPGGLRGTGHTDATLEGLLAEINALPKGGDKSGEDGKGSGPNLQARFGVPPFSVLDARAGYWQARKREWIAFGIKGDVGRGDSLDAEAAAEAHANPAAERGGGSMINQMLGNRDRVMGSTPVAIGGPITADRKGKTTGAQMLDRAKRKRSASPGGAPMPLDRSNLAGPDGRRMTWAAGTRPLEELDDTSARNAGASSSGASMFDPVLCELMLRWFCPPGGRVLDCFAGGPTLGLVSTHLGYDFSGVEIRKEQIAANELQAKALGLSPRWVNGDSEKIDENLPGGGLFDMVFTDPPYFNLEFYSADEANGSAKKTYAEFRKWYRNVLTAAADVLKPNRFMVVKIGEARDSRGAYVNIVGDTNQILIDAGLLFYNEAILVTAIGSLPVRAGRPFETARKLGKAHQNVLIFLKGNIKKTVAALGDVSASVELLQTESTTSDGELQV